MQNKYVYNFHNILENHKDIADYEMFYSSYRIYIETHLDEHNLILEILKKCLLRFKNKTLIIIVYKLLFHIKADLILDWQVVKKHLKKKSLRKYIFPILPEDFISDKKIKKWLDCQNYEEENFFRYIKNKTEIINNYTHVPNREILRKQLLIILYTKTYTNLDVFFNYLGSNNRNIGFILYEILCQLVSENYNFRLHNLKVKNGNINFNLKIKIDNLDNFFLYFFCFMEEKHIVYNLLIKNNIIEIEKILKDKYVITNKRLTKIRNLSCYNIEVPQIKTDNENFNNCNMDFDFLFGGKNYKTFSDCVEL